MAKESKLTLVMGATENPERYAFMAMTRLQVKGFSALGFGPKPGKIGQAEITDRFPEDLSIHTITLYLRPEIQKQYYDRILNSGAKRLIFNPGTENPELAQMAEKAGMEVVFGCTLVMLNLGDF